MKMGDGTHKWSELEYMSSNVEISAGNGIAIDDNVIGLDDLVLDCGTSTTNI